jgi:peptide/nickel transport system ATP-binding protein
MKPPIDPQAAPVLELEDVAVSYFTRRGEVPAVTGVSLIVAAGESVGLVGESGCGKSTLAFAIMRYFSSRGRIVRGRILFNGHDLATRSPDELRAIRGGGIAMVHQDPMAALNPSLTVGEQLAEVLVYHAGAEWGAASKRALAMLTDVELSDPARIMASYPYQLSGGQQQRVVIAMALLAKPALLVLDEPTTGLDVTVEAGIVALIADLRARHGTSLLYISHNLGLIARVSDRLAVMYSGQIIEEGPVAEVFAAPRHPYTIGLFRCIPQLSRDMRLRRLQPIRGTVTAPHERPLGCVFAPRCDHFQPGACDLAPVPIDFVDPGRRHGARCLRWRSLDSMASESGDVDPRTPDAGEIALSVRDLRKQYAVDDRGLIGLLTGRALHYVQANQKLDFAARRGRTLAVVGESGCGKSTLGKILVGLEVATSGEIWFEGTNLANLPVEHRPINLLRAIQMVFQNPDETLNPSYSIASQIARVIRKFGVARGRREVQTQVRRLLDLTRLSSDLAGRLPRQLSGGEKQRVAIARAFAGNPTVVVADEPLSSLDVSVRAAITDLLMQIQRQDGTTLVLISHDLSLVRYVADSVVVMYLGHIMEAGTTEQVFAPPYHPYTEALLAAIPLVDPTAVRTHAPLRGPVPSALTLPEGCPFHTRCPRKVGRICEERRPPEQISVDGHRIACHIPSGDLATVDPLFGPAVVPRSGRDAAGVT